jgi:oligosaccharide repeat unit polymerase
MLTTLLAALVLLGLSATAALRVHWSNPVTLYCGTWGSVLLVLVFAGDVFFPVPNATIGLILASVASFMLGAAIWLPLATRGVGHASKLWNSASATAVLNAFAFLAALAGLSMLVELLGEAGVKEAALRLVQNRSEAVEASGATGRFGVLKNAPLLAQFVVVVELLRRHPSFSWTRFLVGLLSWIALELPSGSKIIAIQIPIVVLFAFAITRVRFPWIAASMLGFVASTLFASGIYYINFLHMALSGETMGVNNLLTHLASYIVGGVVGLGQIQGDLPFIEIVHSPLRGVYYIVNAISVALGGSEFFEIGTLHAPFVRLGPGVDGNIYTALYAYYGVGGIVGVMFWSWAAGLLSASVFTFALQRRGFAQVLYPFMCYMILLSPFAENLFGAVLFVIKLAVLYLFFQVLVRVRSDSPADLLTSGQR